MSRVATLGLSWRITGPGSAILVWTLPDAMVEIHTTYVGDGLGSVLRAAADLAIGSGSAWALLESEPGGTSLLFGGAGTDVYLQIVSFAADLQRSESRWSGGHLLWHGRLDVHQFLRQTVRMAEDVLGQVGGADAYGRLWGGTAFPSATLERLKRLTEARPRIVYEPVLLDDLEEAIVYQGGGFPTEAEAQKVLDIWRAEGRMEHMAINLVPLYDTADQWEADR